MKNESKIIDEGNSYEGNRMKETIVDKERTNSRLPSI